MKNLVESRLPKKSIPWLAVVSLLVALPVFAEDDDAPRLTIKNDCPYTLWIQQDFIHTTNDPIVVEIESGGSYPYNIPEAGLASTRFWPKANCNQWGYDCAVGESVGVPSAQQAGHQTPDTIFDPDINSKFEATWGCLLANPEDCAVNPSSKTHAKLGDWTYWDGSVVDGYTFAYTIEVSGEDLTCKSVVTGDPITDPSVDCGDLRPTECPKDENLSTGGKYNTINGQNVTDVNLQYLAYTDSSDVVGCFSPCSKLTSAQWEGWSTILGGLVPQSPQADMYCCPTPPVSAPECRAGVAPKTRYVQSIHHTQNCNAYGYAYDDGIGLVQCKAPAQYLVTFCPGGNAPPIPSQRREPQTFCNPNVTPKQMCPPGNIPCPDCGRDSCPCPPA